MIIIKKLKIKDSKEIASLHNLAFFNFFLTSLGISFLNVFYTSIIKSDQGIALGAFYEGKLVGFAIGAKNKSGFYKTLLQKNFISLSLSACSSLIKSPFKIIKLLQSFFSKESSDEIYLNYATLLSICVDPEQKGQKIGKLLLEAFELEVAKYNNAISLTTDKINNDYVNNFYTSNNYKLVNQYNQGNRIMNFYIKKFK
jgi:ribosomal protein S18 acetylase RimI-like enzyme